MSYISRNDAEALIPQVVIDEIMQGVVRESKAMQMFRRLPNGTTGQTQLRILDSLPLAYWQTSETALKNTTSMAWDKKFIKFEELAVIVPIAEATLADADYDIWAEVKPRLIEAFAKKFDQAVFTGAGKPAGFRADILTSVRTAGANITQGANQTLYSAINDAMVKVEESGYNVTGVIGGVDLKGKFRMMVDTTGQPIKGSEIDSLPKAYIDNGAWDKTKAQLIVGDFTQAVYSIRQDITFKILDQAVIQDPSDNSIIYNLAQQDMVAIRAVMRIGYEIPNPVNALGDDTNTRFPFALIEPATAVTTYEVTFTVTDTSSAAVAGAKVILDGQEKITDANGEAVFKANANTTGNYIVKKGSKVVTGTVAVATADVDVEVENF